MLVDSEGVRYIVMDGQQFVKKCTPADILIRSGRYIGKPTYIPTYIGVEFLSSVYRVTSKRGRFAIYEYFVMKSIGLRTSVGAAHSAVNLVRKPIQQRP